MKKKYVIKKSTTEQYTWYILDDGKSMILCECKYYPSAKLICRALNAMGELYRYFLALADVALPAQPQDKGSAEQQHTTAKVRKPKRSAHV